ncbi:MAG: twin-arginine translocase subunit TatC [Chlamydiales bacterium]|nr:twin-arginine translocase subunit TatC [Chlamydiales bacterium]
MVEDNSTFWEHLDELRKVLIRTLFVVFCATALSFTFYQDVLTFLTLPLRLLTEQGQGPWTVTPDHLVVLGPMEGFSTALKACFWFGLVVSSPVWLWMLFRFVAPALHRNEKGLVIPVATVCLLFLIMGLIFGFYVAIPLANQALFAFNGTVGKNLWTLSLYLDYTVLLLLANALAFELSALLFLAVHFGLLSAQWLVEKRRIMCVVIFIISALLTPPDVFTLFLMAIPLLVIYECIVLYAKWRQPGFNAKQREI